MFVTFEKKGAYCAVHKDCCGHLHKHGGTPKDPSMYKYSGKFPTLAQARSYAGATGLTVKQCCCI